MPRKAREKASDSIYHIMCRSVSELLLFRDDDDKAFYLELLKKYKDKYNCSIYAYCIMDNHLHLHFDPRGFDISKFMKGTNTSYAQYYNKKYKRHGHLFQDRFASRILSTDGYNLAVSAYIHNNAKDIEGYSGREHLYRYSSYGIYLGIRKDTLGLLDKGFIRLFFSTPNEDLFIKHYSEFVMHQRDIGSMKNILEKLPIITENEYRSGRKTILRDRLPSQVISYISDRILKSGKSGIMLKSKVKLMEYRAFCAYVMRVLCGLGYREICENMYNITVSGCARLCSRGYELMKIELYAKIFDELACVG